MLHIDLWGADRKGDTAAESIRRLMAHPPIVRELHELFDVLDEEARLLPAASLGSPTSPLVLHARYTQNEALAAVGASTIEAPRRIREGVYFDRDSNTDLFFVTLEKSDRDYSPSTRYRDYAISPTLFHWESQSTTSSDSPTGRRYRSQRVVRFSLSARRAETIREMRPHTPTSARASSFHRSGTGQSPSPGGCSTRCPKNSLSSPALPRSERRRRRSGATT